MDEVYDSQSWFYLAVIFRSRGLNGAGKNADASQQQVNVGNEGEERRRNERQ